MDTPRIYILALVIILLNVTTKCAGLLRLVKVKVGENRLLGLVGGEGWKRV